MTTRYTDIRKNPTQNFSLTTEIVDYINHVAKRSGVSKSEAIRQIVADHIARNTAPTQISEANRG